jgi:hypothetical protein
MFLCPDPDPSDFDFKSIPLKQISTDRTKFDPSLFHTIMTVTRGLTQSEYEMFKKEKVNVVAFTCGNAIMHHLEDFVRGPAIPGTSSYIGRKTPCDEIWTIPSYAHSLEYISLIRGRPAFVVPHLWSSEIISESVEKKFKKPKSFLSFDPFKHFGKKIDIIILEPNIALFKTAWLPIVASEKLNIEHEDILGEVYVFNFPKHSLSTEMTQNLSVSKKMRYFSRLSIPEILIHFNNKNTFPIIVSHQVLNSLNYLYYEALFYGWPLVHNSPDLDGCGYYYPENNLGACVEAILKAYNNHNKTLELYIEKSHNYLKRVDPLDKEMGKIWNGFVTAGIAKNNSE